MQIEWVFAASGIPILAVSCRSGCLAKTHANDPKPPSCIPSESTLYVSMNYQLTKNKSNTQREKNRQKGGLNNTHKRGSLNCYSCILPI